MNPLLISMAEKGETKLIITITICIILVSIGFSGCVGDEKHKLTIYVYFENLWNSPPTLEEPLSYNISIYINDKQIYTEWHNSSYIHPDAYEIGTFHYTKSNIELKAINEDYELSNSKSIDLGKYSYVTIYFSYIEATISPSENEPTFE
jgi:hypothetical protein